MLIRYKKTFEKIAMGLLSFMPTEKDLKKLQQTIKQYETDENWHLFLYKVDEDIIGLVGICQNNSDGYIVQHISVNPSYRNQGIGKSMIKTIREMFPDAKIEPVKEIESFFMKCSE